MLALREKHDPAAWFADPDVPVNFETYLLEVDGQAVAAITGRMTIEGFIMLDRQFGSPRDRLEVAKVMVETGRKRARELMIPEVHIAALPKKRSWFKRLLGMDGVYEDKRYHAILTPVYKAEE